MSTIIHDRIRATVDARIAELKRTPWQKPPRDRCRLSHWFPVVAQVLPPSLYPRTTIVEVENENCGDFIEPNDPEWSVLTAAVDRIKAQIVTTPIYLRCDKFSGKHCGPQAVGPIWDVNEIGEAIIAISNIAGMSWHPDDGTDVWAIRELLRSADADLSISGLPIGSEWRLIVRDGVVTDESGFYWPADALVRNSQYTDRPISEADATAYVRVREEAGYPEWIRWQSQLVAATLGGDWSVDWMRTTDGWKLIDMALASESWIPKPRR